MSPVLGRGARPGLSAPPTPSAPVPHVGQGLETGELTLDGALFETPGVLVVFCDAQHLAQPHQTRKLGQPTRQ